jgi:hypothetical protein
MKQLWSVSELFDGRILVVPDYQRGYAWDEPQIRDFLEDLEILRPGHFHYAGTVVLHEQQEQEMDVEGRTHVLHHVVDGQQRLTTITILLAAIHRELKAAEGGDPVLAHGIENRFLWVRPRKSTKSIPKLQLFNDLGDYFQERILRDDLATDAPGTRAAQRLDDAKKRFAEHLGRKRRALGDEYAEWLVELYRKVTEQMKTTLFQVKEEAEVGVIFELMNNRGKPLSELEKVKNYLLYAAAKLDGGTALASAVNGTWARVLESLMSGGLVRTADEDQLLRTHWLMAYDADDRKWAEARSIKEHLDVRTALDDGARRALDAAAHTYLESLQAVAVAFRDIERPEATDSFGGLTQDRELRRQIALFSERLRRIGVVAPFRPLLAAVRIRLRDPAAYLQVLEACERFSFLVYRVAALRTNAGRSSLHRLAHRVFKGEAPLEEVLRKLDEWMAYYCRRPQYDRFWELDDGDPTNFYAWGGVRYLLYEWEQHLAGNKEVRLSWRQLHEKQPRTTIEHVLPQTPEDRYWTDRFTAEQHALWVHDIGNLCITEDNSSYSNKPFPRKRGTLSESGRCYANSTLHSERALAREGDWTADTIRRRRQDIVEWARGRWPHPGDTGVDEDLLADEAAEEEG